jgi:putative ABC transport system ATP-binding protein
MTAHQHETDVLDAGVGTTPPRTRRASPFRRRGADPDNGRMSTRSVTIPPVTVGADRQAPAVAVRAEAAVKVYGRGEAAVRALDDVSVAMGSGRFTAVMGPSGSGKSTLLHCMAGLDELTSGRVFVGDVDLGRLSDRELTHLRRDRLGFVFQSFNLLPVLTAAENITLPLGLAGRRPDAGWLDAVVATVGLADRLGHRPSELSGGQQQRVAVARALAGRPEVVFADEPTGNLDSRSGGEVLGLLRRAVDEMGQTIVMVTHDPVAAAHADAVVFLADGRRVEEMEAPTAERVLERMKAFGS